MADVTLTLTINVDTWGGEANYAEATGRLTIAIPGEPTEKDTWIPSEEVVKIDFRWGADETGAPVVLLPPGVTPKLPKGLTMSGLVAACRPHMTKAVARDLQRRQLYQWERDERDQGKCVRHTECQVDEAMAIECYRKRTAKSE